MSSVHAPSQLHHFPAPGTSFVGRETELAEIVERLADPACRLLTLVGPGGIGKTRLAMEAARQAQAFFPDGVFFVSLQALGRAGDVPDAIAQALDIQLTGAAEPEAQVGNTLAQRRLLLLLDNVEHLLPAAVVLPEALVQQCPNLTILITSRAVLNIAAEWRYGVAGLPYPQTMDEPDLAAYGAVQLFERRARQVRRDFSLGEERMGVARICRLVEGSPLALELAAGWSGVLDAGAIADEIERGLEILTTQLHNAPDQHRSMQAVFDQTWSFLSDKEQAIFRRLSVFVDGFRREAAEPVAGATLTSLYSFVNKSLVRRDTSGRYHIHELLRQFAAARLANSIVELTQVQRSHAAYYRRFLQQRYAGSSSPDQAEVWRELEAEYRNLAAALDVAIKHGRDAVGPDSVYAYYLYCDARGRCLECSQRFERYIQVVAQESPSAWRDQMLVHLHAAQGWNYIRLGEYQESRRAFAAAGACLAQAGLSTPPGFGTDPETGIAMVALVTGDYEAALHHGETARARSQEAGDELNLQVAFYVLESAARSLGRFDEARAFAQQGLQLTEAGGNGWMSANLLGDLGEIAATQADYVAAHGYYRRAYDLKTALGDPEGEAALLNAIGAVSLLRGEPQEARRQAEQALALYRNLNDKGGLATALTGLANACITLADYDAARRYLYEGLTLAGEIHFTPLSLRQLVCAGELYLAVGRSERGTPLLSAVLRHPATGYATRQRAQAQLDRSGFDQDSERTPLADEQLADLIRQVATELVASLPMESSAPAVSAASSDASTPGPASVAPNQALAEPLTDREAQVLQLMAEGLTNPEIAAKLILSVGTVKWYGAQIYGKLGVKNRTQAVQRGRTLKLL